MKYIIRVNRFARLPLLYLLLFVHYLGRVYKRLWSKEDRNYRCEATVPSVGTSRRYASLIPWRDNYVAVFIRAGYATLSLSGKTTRQRAKDAIRWRTTKRRPCVELPMTDLPLDHFDWFRGCQILGQPGKGEKIDPRSIPYYNFSPRSSPLASPSSAVVSRWLLFPCKFLSLCPRRGPGRCVVVLASRSRTLGARARVWPAEKNSSSFVALGCSVGPVRAPAKLFSSSRRRRGLLASCGAIRVDLWRCRGKIASKGSRRGWLVGRATYETLSDNVRLESNVRVANGNTVRFRKHRGIADVNLKHVRIRGD